MMSQTTRHMNQGTIRETPRMWVSGIEAAAMGDAMMVGLRGRYNTGLWDMEARGREMLVMALEIGLDVLCSRLVYKFHGTRVHWVGLPLAFPYRG